MSVCTASAWLSWHFWLATIGIVLYAASMWVTGIMEGLMWREVDANGFLVNSFADTVAAKFPMYVVRGLGGVMFLAWRHHHVLQPVDDRSRGTGQRGQPVGRRSRLNKEGRSNGNSRQT